MKTGIADLILSQAMTEGKAVEDTIKTKREPTKVEDGADAIHLEDFEFYCLTQARRLFERQRAIFHQLQANPLNGQKRSQKAYLKLQRIFFLNY